jgi:hypothetical protein
MSGALKFVKVIVALPFPGGTVWKSAYKFQFMPWPTGMVAGPRLARRLQARISGEAKPGRQLAVLNQVRMPLAATKRLTRRICR